MKQTINQALLAAFIVASVNVQAAQSPGPLMQAHQAYMQRDDQGMLKSLEEVFKAQPLSQPVRENVRELLTKSFELNKGNLKTDVKLPKELLEIKIVTRRTQSRNGVDNIVEVKGVTQTPGLIKNIEFTKYPNVEILNKANPRFEWSEFDARFYLKNKNAGVLSDGLYRLVVVMKDGQTLDAWLPLIDLAVNDSPDISQPGDGETTLNRNPELHWQLFPLLKPLAYQAKLSVEAVLNTAPAYKWDVKWGFYSSDVTKNSVVIGREVGGKGVEALPPGRYELIVNQAAVRNYGPIAVSTQSARRTILFIRQP